MFRVATRVLCRKSLTQTTPNCSTIFPKRYAEVEKSGTGRGSLDNSSRVTLLKKYWFFRYVDYIKNYDKVLERNFPKSMHVYRVFGHGTRQFYLELKHYLQVRKKARNEGLDSLSREELQLSFTMPRDLVKMAPVLLISALPFTNYLIFPLAFAFPHLLLTSHYWSIQDKLNFLLKEHKRRLLYNKPLFRCLQNQVAQVRDPKLHIKFKDIVAHLGSGTHPKVDEILACKKLFSGPPFALSKIKRKHVINLLKVHGMSRFGLNHRQKLFERGLLIKRMDTAIVREGGVVQMPYDAIRWALSFRGLNPVNMSVDGMQVWLDQWLLISSQVDEDSISLLLHCPILLAYNHQTNWTLLYHHYKKNK